MKIEYVKPLMKSVRIGLMDDVNDGGVPGANTSLGDGNNDPEENFTREDKLWQNEGGGEPSSTGGGKLWDNKW